jgi:outer membrane protein
VKRNDKSVLRLLLAMGSWCLLGATYLPSPQGLTLDEYYAAALNRSEVVANQVELIRQAEERYTQARAGLLPSLDGVAAYMRQERVPSSSSGSLAPNQSSARLTVTQPIFRGFREFAGLRQTQALIGAQNQDYLNARLQLFKDVTQNFYDILSLEQELKNVDEQISLNLKRESELRGRVRIGRSRITEVLAVETSISTLRAEAEELRGRLRASREAFAFLSGLLADVPLRDTETVPETVEPLADYLAQLGRRPDLKASQQRLAAADENVAVAKGERLPTVDLTGNYYLDRSGILEDVNWDVQIALTVPLYRGGAIQSRVREAASQRTQAELSQSQLNRVAEQEIRTAYETLTFNRAQLEALERATEAARRNYEAQSRDYRLGLVTNLDVLQALTVFYDNQRALDRARFAIKLSYLRLQAAAVRRPPLPEGVTQ